MSKLSIKKIHRLIYEEKPKALKRYIRKFIPQKLEKQSPEETRLDEYVHLVIKNKNMVSKESVLKKISELTLVT